MDWPSTILILGLVLGPMILAVISQGLAVIVQARDRGQADDEDADRVEATDKQP